MSGPPVVRYCVSCKHPAHGGRVCGVRTFFTGTCRCHLENLIDELRRLDTRTSRETADALESRQAEVDFDERKASREYDEEWYPDDRD